MFQTIDESLLENYRTSRLEVAHYEDKIINKLDDIFKNMFNIFGAKLDYWYVDGAEEGQVGDIGELVENVNIHEIDNTIKVNCIIWGFKSEPKNFREPDVNIIINGRKIILPSEIPSRWLSMEQHEINEEIIRGKEEFEKQQEEKRAKEKEKKAKVKAKKLTIAKEKQNMLKSIKSKLTPEEQKLLKI